ncbi:OATP domain containing protein [Trichuris trichiura]|uniref:OATP domain containing protein n=1 Tax=Trichuris trichiura TaxID=36087 RepID=A0A077Z4D2_TRITR|nr:OATP domain containing protein [Trichuris trichiura]
MSDYLRNLMTNILLGILKFSCFAKLTFDEVNNIVTASFSSEKWSQLMLSHCNEMIMTVKKILQMEKCQTVNMNRIAVGIILFSMVLIGIGHCIPIIDDNVKRQNSPFFFEVADFPSKNSVEFVAAAVVFLRLVGPPLSYTLGAAANRFYFTLSGRSKSKCPYVAQKYTTVDLGDIKTTDNRWISAWWLRFLHLSGCLSFPSLLLFFFSHLKREIRKAVQSVA